MEDLYEQESSKYESPRLPDVVGSEDGRESTLGRDELLRRGAVLGAGLIGATALAGSGWAAPGAYSGRVATLYYDDEVTALGYKPVASGTYLGNVWPGYLQAKLRGAAKVGLYYDPNLEVLLSSRPGRIIATDSLEADVGPKVEAIAQTVYPDRVNWGGVNGVRFNLNQVAKGLDAQDRAAVLMKQYRRRLTDAQKRIPNRKVKGTLAFLRVTSRNYRLVTPTYGYIGPVIYDELKLPLPAYVKKVAPQDTQKFGYVPISLEVLPEIDPDIIFFLGDPTARSQMNDMVTHPLWAGMKAVKNKHTYIVDNYYWQTSAIQSASLKIRDVLKHLRA